MAKKKIDWLEVAVGLGIIGITWIDLVPGDEIIGTPTGAYLIADGLGWL